MAYCTDCGTEVTDAKFCPECGTEVGGSGRSATTEPPAEGEEEDVLKEEEEGINVKMAVTSVAMGVLVGAFVAWAFANIGGSAVLFVVTVAGVGYYLYSRKSSPRSAIGSGLYITALWMVVTPIFFYVPMMGSANTDTAEGAGQAIGSVAGLFIWGIVFFFLAVVVFVIGYFVNKGVDEE